MPSGKARLARWPPDCVTPVKERVSRFPPYLVLALEQADHARVTSPPGQPAFFATTGASVSVRVGKRIATPPQHELDTSSSSSSLQVDQVPPLLVGLHSARGAARQRVMKTRQQLLYESSMQQVEWSMLLIDRCPGYVRRVTHDEIADAIG
jgi:hypothetical protein